MDNKKKTMNLKQLESLEKYLLIGFAVVASAIIIALAIAAVNTGIKIGRATDAEALADRGGGLTRISTPELPEPISIDDGVENYDLFEYTLWEAETEYIEAYNHYEAVYLESAEFADITGREHTAESFDRINVTDYKNAVMESLPTAREVASRLRTANQEGREVNRDDLVSHTTYLTFLYKATDFTDTHAAYGTQACSEAIRNLQETLNHIYIGLGIVILMLVCVLGSVMLSSRKVAAAKARRPRPQINYAPIGAPEEDEDGTPITEASTEAATQSAQ